MSGWVALNSLTIWLSSVSVAPDHMVCQVIFTTPPADADEDEEAPLLAAGPPHAARASAQAAASTAGTAPSVRRDAACPGSPPG